MTGPRHAEYVRRLGEWSNVQDHMPFFYDTASSYEHPVIIELGVCHTAYSTSAFLAAAETADGDLWSVDVDDPGPVAWRGDPRWHLILGDDLDAATAAQLPQWCDVLFVDTMHTYEHTIAEMAAYMPRVRGGGVALFHDTHLPDPAVGGGDPGRLQGGVTQALYAWCGDNGRTWENRTGSYGLGVIHV